MNNHRFIRFCILFVGGIMLFTPYSFLSLFILIGFILLFFNKIVIKKVFRHSALFSSKREIKHYNSIVIGDFVKSSVYEDYCDVDAALIFTSPNRTLNASYQILLHMISCLDEGGTCVIIHNSHNKPNNDYSLFELPYLHFITQKELNIESLKSQLRYPLLYEPAKSLKLLLGITSNGYKKAECPNREIINFCRRKNISLIYLDNK